MSDGDLVALVDRGSGVWIYSANLDYNESRQLATALQHFAVHGTFCPEPPKPIEWRESIQGVLWVSGEWFVSPSIGGRAFYTQRGREGHFCSTLDDAKAYAEKRIREESRDEKAE